MRIYYPLVRGLAGGDIYFERLSSAMNKLNINTEIKYYPQNLGVAPFLVRMFYKNLESCDIIHSNGDYGFAFKVGSKPLVVTAHHLVFDPLYQQYTSLSQKIYHKMLFRYVKKSLNVADCIIAISENTRNEIKRIYGITDVNVIYNGIDTEIFKPMEIENSYPDKVKLLFVGNLTKRKGADLLPKIMEKLDDRFILFYTSGLRTKKVFPNDSMFPLGKLSLSKLVEMYNLCDMLIAPSRLEGFGYSVAEAMACGKSVVATDYSSLPELIDDGKGGFLCEMDDVDVFVERIQTLASDDGMRKRFGVYNRKKVQERFSLERMSRKYLSLYQGLV